jgi:hypothetical protein
MTLHDRLRRTGGFCLAIALLLAPIGADAGGIASPDVWPAILASWDVTLPVASGVEYEHVSLTTSAGPLEIHELRVDLRNPTVQLGVGLAHDQLMSSDEPVSSMVARSGAIAGINADYFDINQTGIPLNIVIKDGRLLRSPWRWVALVVGKDGIARIIRYRWTGTVVLTETGETHPLDGYNSGLSPNGIVAISDMRGRGAPPPDPGVQQTVVELTPADDAGHYFVKEVWPQQGFNTPFPEGELILVGRGAASAWLQARMTAGSPVQVNLTTDPDWHDARLAVGGGPILVDDGQVVQDPDAPAPGETDYRYPVIAVGIGRDGQSLTFVEVDGRQPLLSIGLTRPQLARYMQTLGAYQAMAFDSGGSATMVVRLPGQSAATVVNSPSDGSERPIADAILVQSTAVPGPPARLLVNAGQPLELLAGAHAALSVIAVDAQGNPVPLADPLQAAAPPGLVTVGADGTITAGASPGSGTLTVQSGPASGTLSVSVVTRLARLVATPAVANVAPGSDARFALRGVDASGRPVVLPDGVAWSVDPPWLGTMTSSGDFTAGDTAGQGTLTARLGGAVARARVSIGSTARYVSAFDRGDLAFRGYPDTVTGAVSRVSSPGREGHPSARLEFRLDGTGTRAAYLMTDLPLAGKPMGITLWVYGDGSGVWLRGIYAQSGAEHERGTVTLARHVDWQGWRAVTAMLPPDVAYPVTWLSIYVVDTDPNRTPRGVIYLSDFRAIYAGGPAR